MLAGNHPLKARGADDRLVIDRLLISVQPDPCLDGMISVRIMNRSDHRLELSIRALKQPDVSMSYFNGRGEGGGYRSGGGGASYSGSFAGGRKFLSARKSSQLRDDDLFILDPGKTVETRLLLRDAPSYLTQWLREIRPRLDPSRTLEASLEWKNLIVRVDSTDLSEDDPELSSNKFKIRFQWLYPSPREPVKIGSPEKHP